MTVSSRTPDGEPNRCPICGGRVIVEPSADARDAPCPRCGHLLWWLAQRGSRPALHQDASARTRLADLVAELESDSLDLVEFVMELEEEFGITIPDKDAERIHTIGDAVQYITREES